MKILCHRGFWHKPEEKNSLVALKFAVAQGYGFESDVRDYCGQLVISHDIANEKSPALEEVLKILAGAEDKFCFAINIKADGLVGELKNLLEKYSLKNYFVFDMSVPQMLWYRNAGMKFFTRQSEFEKFLTLYDEAAGVWLDAFESDDWITVELIKNHLARGKKVCVVSPELHEREPQKFWSLLKQIKSSDLYLCTDLPTKAEKFFGRCDA
ncbi:MAG: hypothetical protein IJQ82_10360 [Selenomonadaceae bacterium]|nr:hypothetical protein [Selenomonadaceae bacterium]